MEAKIYNLGQQDDYIILESDNRQQLVGFAWSCHQCGSGNVRQAVWNTLKFLGYTVTNWEVEVDMEKLESWTMTADDRVLAIQKHLAAGTFWQHTSNLKQIADCEDGEVKVN